MLFLIIFIRSDGAYSLYNIKHYFQFLLILFCMSKYNANPVTSVYMDIHTANCNRIFFRALFLEAIISV